MKSWCQGLVTLRLLFLKKGTELLNNGTHLLIDLFICKKQQEILGLLVGIVK